MWLVQHRWVAVMMFAAFMHLAFYSSVKGQTLQPVEDAMVYRGGTGSNYGSDVKLQVKKTDGSNITRNAYLKFDLSSVSDIQVGKAKLRLYCNNKAVDSLVAVMAVFSTASSWTEATLNWNNAPYLGTALASTVIGSKLNYYEWDVTDYIRQSAGTITSMCVSDIIYSNNLIEFSSREAINKPELVISPIADTISTAVDYYLDAVTGNDANDGTSPATPWKTVHKVNNANLATGAGIHFKSGQTFKGLLVVPDSGTAARPVVINTYGGTEPAILDGVGQQAALFAYNKPNLEIKNLVIKNFRTGTILVTDRFSAVVIMSDDAGVVNHIRMDSLIVDSVNSSTDEATSGTVYNGGVQFFSTGSRIPSSFNDVIIQNCTFQNLSRTGCNFRSDWDLRNLNTTFGSPLGDGRTDNWTPSTNIIIKDNHFRKIAGNGLIVRVAFKALIEANLFDSCGTTISGNACFNFNTDSAVYQYNEAKNTVYNNGDTDARGIDSDYRTKNTLIQYNYLHDNGLGGVVATGGDQTSGQIPQRFNVGTVIRYNLIENNNLQGIAFSGAIDGLDVYNNTIYADNTHNDIVIVRSAVWAVAPKNLRFKNNIFYFKGTNLTYSFASGSTYNFTNNLFFGNRPASEPPDANKLTGDPKFVSTTVGPSGYKYLIGSAALNTGVIIPNNGGRDYYGHAVSPSAQPNVGMYNGPAIDPMPLHLLAFDAKKRNAESQLTWITSSESEMKAFDIERSFDGKTFSKIGTVTAQNNVSGNSSYVFTDVQPGTGLNYYRLRILETDNSHSYSPVRLLAFGQPGEKVSLYPNPAENHIWISYSSSSERSTLASIYDIHGKKVKEQSFAAGSSIDFDITDLPKGIYTVRLYTESAQQAETARFLKF